MTWAWAACAPPPEKKQFILACAQTLFYFSFRSFRKHRRARENERPSLAGNKSPAVYILSPALDWRVHRHCFIFLFVRFKNIGELASEVSAQERTRSAREKMSIFFFPHHYPLALAVNKSPAVYILSPFLDALWRGNWVCERATLDGLWRENRGTVNRLNLNVYGLNFSSYADNN